MKRSSANFSLGFGTLWESVGKGSTTLALATIAGGAMVFLATPFVTRVFDPAALGDYRLYLSAVALLSPIATQNYVEAVALPASDDDAWSLVRSVLANTTLFSIVALVAIAAASFADAVGVVRLHVALVWWIVPFGVFFAGAQATMLRWLVRGERYAPTVTARVAQGATMAAGQPLLGLVTGLQTGAVGALPLAGADAFSTGVGFVLLARGSGDRGRLRHLIGIQRDRMLLRRYRHFLTAGLPATEVNTLTLQIPFLVIAATYGASSAGQYALVERLILTPVGVITSAITIVLARQSAMRAEDPAAVRQMFIRITAMLALLGSPLLILGAFEPKYAVARLFGPEWVPAAEMLRPLALLYFTNLVITPWGAAVVVAERQDLFLLREIVRLVIVAGAAGSIVLATPSVTTAVAILAVAGIVSYLWYWVVCSWALHHPRPPRSPGLEAAAEGGPT